MHLFQIPVVVAICWFKFSDFSHQPLLLKYEGDVPHNRQERLAT